SEIMYRPAVLSSTSGNRDDEYLELLNTTSEALPLFAADAPTNTWRLRGGVDFYFPPGITLAPGESLLLLPFDPTDVQLASAFRSHYGVSPNVRLFGPYAGKLDNSGDALKLQKPSAPVPGVVPYVLVDEVEYSNAAPWPAGADGSGLSLQRTAWPAFGNDPANWVAAVPSAGALTASGIAPIIVAQPLSQRVVVRSAVSLNVIANGNG